MFDTTSYIVGYEALEKENKELKEQNALMRQALEAVEIITDGFYPEICPWCEKYDELSKKHAPDCLRQRALGIVEEQ